jgi:DNA-binding IclR family transcriptional regulator
VTLEAKPDLPLERYFKVLEAIAACREKLGVSEISHQCDLPLATSHRLLQNLESAGLVTNGGGYRKEYQLGGRLLRLLHAGSDVAWLTISAQPILDKLAKTFGDTCFLAKLTGHEVVSIAWAVPGDGLRANVIPGYKMPPHVAASAKAILAFQTTELIDRALAGALPKLTPETKTSRKEIENEYASVRENGFATCWNEMELGMGGLAVPIRLSGAGIIYSLGTAGLIDRLTRRPLEQSLKTLRAAVDPLSKVVDGSQGATSNGADRVIQLLR